MDVFDAVTARRSVKRYDPAHRMTEAEVERLLRAAILSPTAFNIQNWRFVVVENPELRTRIRDAAGGQPQVTEASLLIVLTADLKAWDRDPARYWREAGPDVQSALVPRIRAFYQNHPQVERDEALRSVGMAAQTLMLGAKAMGYDSCPMIGFDQEVVGRLIALPPDHVIGMMVAIGKATSPARPRGGQLPLEEVVRYDRF